MDGVYKIVFNTIQEGLILTDDEGNIRLVNPRTEKLFGYSEEELIGQKIEILIPNEYREKHVVSRDSYQKRPVNRQMGSGMTLFGKRKDGSKFPLEISLNSFLDDHGNRFVSALITDIYIRKKAQDEVLRINENLEQIVTERTQELYESKQLYESISKHFPTGAIYVLDLDFKIDYADGMEFVRLGQNPMDILGEDYVAVSGENRRKMLSMLNKLIEEGAVAPEFIHKADEYYKVNASLLRDTAGKLSRILIVENNITQQKETEESLEKNIEEQRRLNLLKSRFVSFASHEFRTPLTTMSSSADLIRRYLEMGENEKIQKHINRIQQSVVYMTSLLNDFLSLDKIDSGVVSINKQHIDLSKLLEECIEETSGLKKLDQRIEIQNNIEKVDSDPFMLKSILINLISNGLKYSGDQGLVSVSALMLHDEFQICVKDNGMGIPQSELQNLFTRFFRASNAQEIKGTGLGLHIVSRHVDMLGGRITCESEEGVGTQFCIYLPSKQPKTEQIS
jgi:PAS domain S-box-containing protein